MKALLKAQVRQENARGEWSQSYRETLRIREIYPHIWDIPLSRGLQTILQNHLANQSGPLLDFGASETSQVRAHLQGLAPEMNYFSMDIDRQTRQDYYSWDEIDREFSTILSSEVIEHMSYTDVVGFLSNAQESLAPGGLLILTTPNIFHPTRFLQDPTHQTPWNYDHLGGELLVAGFDLLAFYRFGAPNAPRHLRGKFSQFFMGKVRKNLGLDNAKSICCVARKPQQAV